MPTLAEALNRGTCKSRLNEAALRVPLIKTDAKIFQCASDGGELLFQCQFLDLLIRIVAEQATRTQDQAVEKGFL